MWDKHSFNTFAVVEFLPMKLNGTNGYLSMRAVIFVSGLQNLFLIFLCTTPMPSFVWNSMGLTLHIRQSFNYNVWDWIFFNVRDSKSCYNQLNWNVIFPFCLMAHMEKPLQKGL